jgi:hypothetical protein
LARGRGVSCILRCGCGCSQRPGRVRRRSRGLRRRSSWRRCGRSSGRCRGRGGRWSGAVRRRGRGSLGSRRAFPFVLVRLSRGRRIGRYRRLWRDGRRCCRGRRGAHRGRGGGRRMRRRGGRRRRVRRRCSGGRGYRLGRSRGRRRGRRGVRRCRGRGMRRGGRRCRMRRRGSLGQRALRRLLGFSVRTEFALWSLCNDDRSGLRVRRRAYEVQRRQRRRGKQHETKVCHMM